MSTHIVIGGETPFCEELREALKGTMVPTRSCGTCRDRRTRCDRVFPICRNCSQSGRQCKGYGLRLSWPTQGDRRRAVVMKSAFRSEETSPNSNFHSVDITSWDIEMHHRLKALSLGKSTAPLLCIPMPFSPFMSDDGDRDLLQYFQSSATTSLSTIGHSPVELGNTLMRIAFSGTSTSALAVFRSLLALSSLHRYGLHTQAFELKISSIKALAAASASNLDTKEAIQHVAASMLLCTFEVHQASCTSGQWITYMAGIRQVLKAARFDEFRQDSDLAILIDWVYYHDVLARIILRFYRGELATFQSTLPDSYIGLSDLEAPDRALTSLLSEVCKAMTSRPRNTMNGPDLEELKSYLAVLDWKITKLPLTSYHADLVLENNEALELYRLAILIYLDRISANLLDQSSKTKQLIQRAFILITQLSACERQFPIFILGCEARNDEQRTAIMDLILRTEKKASSRSLNHVKILIQRVWAQDDLAEGDLQLGYEEMLTGIIGCCIIPPSLV